MAEYYIKIIGWISSRQLPFLHHDLPVKINRRLPDHTINVEGNINFPPEADIVAKGDMACPVHLLILKNNARYFRLPVQANAEFSDVPGLVAVSRHQFHDFRRLLAVSHFPDQSVL